MERPPRRLRAAPADFARGTHNGIVVFDVHGFDRAPTRWPCRINDDAGGELTPPSWGPDGDTLAYSAPDGIWIAKLDGSCDKATVKLVIPGGREPDFGPAQPAQPAGAAAPTPPKGPGGGAPPFDAGVTVASSVRRGALLRRGLTVKVHCGVACKVEALARARGRRVARARTAGTGALRAKLQPRRRAIARARTLVLTVEIRVAGAPTKTVKRSVRLR